MKTSELRQIIKEEIQNELNKQNVQEDAAMVGQIALGVAGGLAGLWVLVNGAAITTAFMGAAAEKIGEKMKQKAKQAITDRNKAIVDKIIVKFDGDSELAEMYKTLPAYSTSISQKAKEGNKERIKKLKVIADYIKPKLTPEEMKYFSDISKSLRAEYNA